VHLTDAEFARLRDEIATADVFTAAKTLRERNYFQREDGTPFSHGVGIAAFAVSVFSLSR
jgi:type I restriction enzyme R subunit